MSWPLRQARTSGTRRPHPRPPCPRQHLAQDTGCNTFGLLAGMLRCGRPAAGPEGSPVAFPTLPLHPPTVLLGGHVRKLTPQDTVGRGGSK